MRRLAILALAAIACVVAPFGPASRAQTPPAQAVPASPADGVPAIVGLDYVLTLNADLTGEFIETRRIKVLGVSVLQQVAQQTTQYVEGMQSFEIVAAFTEKADGTKVPVDPATVITRDAASGLAAMYVRDVKLVTVIFPDVAVGDTLVLSTRRIIHSDSFPGHFEEMVSFARTMARADSTVRVIAPSSLPLQVGVQGDGMEHTVTVVDNETQHLVVYRGRARMPGEDRMTSPLDRDPAVFITTFASYEEMARSYWDGARGAIEVTPEIATLADEITRGIDDKPMQARAISSWVKRNIRYVAIMLGTGRVVPHKAADVLKNRYGDCKDHAVLMATLLAVKGIASEQVLINGTDAYALPEPATGGFINHVILYLPDFGVYDDPTLQLASFGMLSAVEYDKPVVHVSESRAYRARIPAMKPEDHVSRRRTLLSVAADGTMSGETEQFGTGLFAMSERSLSASIQADGLERSAEEYLRRSGLPGKGRFEIGSLAELGDSYSTRASFTYDAPMSIKPGSFIIPVGLGIQARPGSFVLADRLPVRKLPFVCLAGTQIEEIEISFADGLPLPQQINPRRIDNNSFSYSADYSLEGRIFKVRRQFVSHVAGQVCPAELEAELAQPIRDVYASNATRMVFTAAPAPRPGQPPTALETLELKRTAVVDRPLPVDFLYALYPDCSPVGIATVRTLEEPKHGKLTIGKGSGFSNFAQDNPRHACNRTRIEGMQMYYRPDPEYLGADSVTVDVVYLDGTSRKRHYAIAVNPKPAPAELRRAAAAEQQVRIGFLTAVEPDCTTTPYASVRIVEEPQHGEAKLKEDSGFTNFAKENSRFECNKQRSDGTAILYRGEAGYSGKDAVVVEYVYADGRAYSVRYSIDVK